MSRSKYHYNIKKDFRVIRFFVAVCGSQMNKVNKGRSSILTVHMLWGKTRKCSLLQTELKGLMHHTAYFILKRCGSWPDPCHFIQLSAAVLKPSPRVVEMQTGRRKRERAGLAVAKETTSSLLNTCSWWRHRQGSSTHNWGFSWKDGTLLQKRRCVSHPHTRKACFLLCCLLEEKLCCLLGLII